MISKLFARLRQIEEAGELSATSSEESAGEVDVGESDDNEAEVGRRAGASLSTTGSFTLAAGGNRAGAPPFSVIDAPTDLRCR